MKNIKNFIIAIAIPLVAGGLSALVTSNSMSAFESLVKPALSPPAWLFPVAWTILYTLMGIASYLVYINDDNITARNRALVLYALQLFVNVTWPLIFFGLELYALAFVWLILLIILVVLTIIAFYNISKPAAYLMIPYLLWLIFAGYLNLSIAILN